MHNYNQLAINYYMWRFEYQTESCSYLFYKTLSYWYHKFGQNVKLLFLIHLFIFYKLLKPQNIFRYYFLEIIMV